MSVIGAEPFRRLAPVRCPRRSRRPLNGWLSAEIDPAYGCARGHTYIPDGAGDAMTGESHRELTGKVALVVGGTRNIGAALAGALAARGADVAVSFAHHKDAAELTVERLRDLGVAAEAFRADATKAADTTRLFDQAVDRFGGLDIVVHVPGAVLKRPLVEVTDEEYDTGMGYNSRSAFLTLREAGRRIADHGRIILVSPR